MAKFRLLAQAFMHGALREAGHIFELAEGELGPHRSEIVHHERVDVGKDSNRHPPVARDVPLYEPVKDDGPAAPPEG